MQKIISIAKRQWFLAILFGCVAFGFLVPAPGTWFGKRVGLRPVIMLVMFLMSLSMPLSKILSSFLRIRGMGTAVWGGYVLCPLLMFGLAMLPFPQDIRMGLLIVGATPTTLASAAIWTRLAGGNDALSLATTICSNMLSVLAAPLILRVTLGTTSIAVDFSDVAWKLFLIIVVPVVAGQVVRGGLGDRVDKIKPLSSVLSRLLIVSIVLISVSRSTAEGQDPTAPTAGILIGLLAAVAAAHLITAWACWSVSGLVGAERGDRIAAVISGSQKTLPVGLYLQMTFFAAFRFAMLPILFYHASQLIIDTLLVEKLRKGNETPSNEAAEPETEAE